MPGPWKRGDVMELVLKVTDPVVLLSLAAVVLSFRVVFSVVCGFVLKRIVHDLSSEN